MRNTLYEFMPYGAPDLIEARPRHLSRALVLACAGAIVLLGVGMGIGSLIRENTQQVVTTMPTNPDRTVLPPPLVEKLPPPSPKIQSMPNVPVVPRVAIPVPVPDSKLPVEQPQPQAPGDAKGVEDVAPSLPTPVQGTGDALPGPNEYVYVERLPEPLKQVKPAYSEMAKTAGVGGLVRVKVLVGKDGKVMDARIDEKNSVPMLNDAALAAARQWLFTPGMANDQPVICWVSIPFNFRLH